MSLINTVNINIYNEFYGIHRNVLYEDGQKLETELNDIITDTVTLENYNSTTKLTISSDRMGYKLDIMSLIKNCYRLTTLSIFDIDIGCSINSILEAVPTLEELSIYNCIITVSNEVYSNNVLNTLHIGTCRLKNKSKQKLALDFNSIPNLTYLNLRDIRTSVLNLSACTKLEELHLTNVRDSQVLNIQDFSNMNQLRVLYLSTYHKSDISENLWNAIWQIPTLSRIYIKGYNVGRNIPESIGDLTSLSDLTIIHADVREQLPSSIGLLPLKILRLYNNSVSGDTTVLCKCKQLTDIDLGMNNLTVNVPDLVSNLSDLKYISIYGNPGNLVHLSDIPNRTKSLTIRTDRHDIIADSNTDSRWNTRVHDFTSCIAKFIS